MLNFKDVKPGTRVRLVNIDDDIGGKYCINKSNTVGNVGVITGVGYDYGGDGINIRVEWDNNTQNSYHRGNLEVANPRFEEPVQPALQLNLDDLELLDLGMEPRELEGVAIEKEPDIDVVNMTLDELDEKVGQWHEDRNLIDGSTDQAQMLKLMEEFGELSSDIARGKDIKDSIGDIMVVLRNIAGRHKLGLAECYAVAYNDIKDRRGRMEDGIFVKEADMGRRPPDGIPQGLWDAIQRGGLPLGKRIEPAEMMFDPDEDWV